MDSTDAVELKFLSAVAGRMRDAHMSQPAVAARMGVSSSQVSRMLSGSLGLNFRSVFRLCDALGLDFIPRLRSKRGYMESAKESARRRRMSPFERLAEDPGWHAGLSERGQRKYDAMLDVLKNGGGVRSRGVSRFLRCCIVRMRRIGVTQAMLAREMGVSRASVSRIFSGRTDIRFSTAEGIAAALRMKFVPSLRK